MNDEVREQFVLRIKKGTPVDKIMSAMKSTDEPLTNEELGEIGGQKQWEYQFQWLAKMTDNVAILKDWNANAQSMNYINPINTRPVPVGVDAAGIVGLNEAAEPTDSIRWPQAPPLIEGLGDVFRTPDWYEPMKTMVKAGRHISLAGPPGVGKDTGVQELAARSGKVLVTVGGDGGFRKRDLVGSPNISRGNSFLDAAEYAAAVVNGWWVLLSEVNAADADALIFINTQLAPPYIINIAGKAYPVHPDFRLFISYNAGLIGTKPLPQSFKDRFFSIQVPFFTEYQLRRVLEAHGMPQTDWAEIIVRYGVKLWDAHTRGQLRYQVTCRRLQDAVELVKNGVANGVIEALELAVIAAIDSPIEAKTAKQILDNGF